MHLRAVLVLLFLNAMLAFDNWWPTPAIWPDHRLAGEFVWCWVALLAWVKWRGALGARALAALAGAYLLLVVGRYLDVTAPALFGRPVNLYWDAPELPRFLWVSALERPWWMSALAMLAGVALFGGLYLALRAAWRVAARDAAPFALRSRAALALTGAAVALSLANHAGVEATWPLVSRPVTPTWARQVERLVTALSPQRLEQALPPSPPFERHDLAGLRGRDLTLVFVESYGATAYDHPRAAALLGGGRAALAQAVAASGRRVVSAYVRSPTFGGASDLAHLGLLSGLDLSDPRRHDLLLTTARPTLLSHFRAHGYRTYGLYPALSWDWPERAFYGFDVFHDARSLGYRGPHLGNWWIPDQVTLARFQQLHPVAADAPPRLLFFPTITSHFPFCPVPPVQRDWSRVLGDTPFEPAEVEQALAEQPDWLDMAPAYLRMIDYEYRWIATWLEQPRVRDEVVILVGDHQPTANVAGDGARWDVPVHVIASDDALLQRFVAAGFAEGLQPPAAALGPMHELTRLLLRAFSSKEAGGA
jgi:hypothetical protein